MMQMKISKRQRTERRNPFENLKVTSEVEAPKTETFETIKTPNQTGFEAPPVVSSETPINIQHKKI